jgi:hypothetical protein
MAKNSLKIVKKPVNPSDPPTDEISSDGYISVVDQMIVDADGFEDFVGDEEEVGFSRRRTKFLLRIAGRKADSTPTNAEITQLAPGGGVERVTKQNLKIRSNADARRPSSGAAFGKMTIALPEESFDPGAIDYIDNYILTFLREWTGNPSLAMPAAPSNAAKARARKFMFGAMLLTRCR